MSCDSTTHVWLRKGDGEHTSDLGANRHHALTKPHEMVAIYLERQAVMQERIERGQFNRHTRITNTDGLLPWE